VSFISSGTIMDALKARLQALHLVGSSGDPLFQLVEFYRVSDITRAFQDLYFTKHRVCFIVPVNFSHANQRGRHMLTSNRELTVDLLIGDRSLETGKAATAALVGGANNVGVMEMAERIIDDFFTTPLALSDVAVEPDEGAPLAITSEEKPNDPGRVCWVQTLHLRAGMARCNVTV
jgi:hypothetical protein